MAAASGDQLAFALGTFKYDILPGIKTVDKIADDVAQKRLFFPLQDMDLVNRKMDVAFVNSKGFGGNNATAVVLSPRKVENMLSARYGSVMADYQSRREETRQAAKNYAEKADKGNIPVVYRFGEALVQEQDIDIACDGIHMPGHKQDVIFDKLNPWADMD